MDTETHLDNEYISGTSPDEPVFTSYGSGMFAGSHHFTIAGGIFNNNTYVVAPTTPAGFRMLPMGDIDLQRELIVNTESGVVESRRKRNCVRRVYSAKVIGRNSNVTVAMYQGDGAEENWRRHTEMYMSVRHPNIIQTWAGASYGNVHATVFHGDLVPLEAFMDRQSPIMRVYLYACHTGEWSRVEDHFQSLGTALRPWECTMWIRSSTGQLSVDPVLPDTGIDFPVEFAPPIPTPGDPSNVTEVTAIQSLGLRQFHNVCSFYLSQPWVESISALTTVNIGAVILPSQDQYEEYDEIALLTEIDVRHHGWQASETAELAQNGWSRYRADDVFHARIVLAIEVYDFGYAEAWLSQANHLFSRLRIASDLENYRFLECIYFSLQIGDAGQGPPAGFLFLCPWGDFRTGHTSFRWPSRSAYWSLDPAGLEALSMEEAEHLGFPPLQFDTRVIGRYCDASVYAGLRQFHQAKGFDPNSQEVAIHLGQPLFRLSRDVSPPFAHVDDLFDERPDEEEDQEHGEIPSANHDTHEEDEECDFCAHSTAKVHQEPNGGGGNSSSMNQEMHINSHASNERTTGGGLIRRFLAQLQQGLVIETENNVDTDPISPFLI